MDAHTQNRSYLEAGDTRAEREDLRLGVARGDGQLLQTAFV